MILEKLIIQQLWNGRGSLLEKKPLIYGLGKEWLIFVLAVNLGSLGRVFPPGQQSKTILGCNRRTGESIPVAHSEVVDVPMWNQVVVPEQGSVERFRANDQFLSIGRGN